MPYQILCNGVKRVGVKASLDLTSGLFCHVPLHKIWYGILRRRDELDFVPHGIYDRIHSGTIQISKDQETHLYMFPDEPATLDEFKQLLVGSIKKLCF